MFKLTRYLAARPTAILGLIILAGAGARLFRIDAPFADWHQYRQFDTAALARNLAEESLNVFYPRVDWRGNSPGYVEVEFQAFTLPVALLYRVFGVHEWLARVLNLFFYASTAFLLYRLTCRIFDRRVALFGAGLYSFLPLSFFVSRNFQPDTLMMLCCVAGVYYFLMWVEQDNWKSLILSAVSLAIAVLIKPYCMYLGVPLIYLCGRKFGWRFLIKPAIWLYSLVVIFPMAAWYVHAFDLWKLYGNTFGIFGGRIKGAYLGADVPNVAELVGRLTSRLVWEIATPVGLPLVIVGFLVRPPSRNYLFHWWMLGFLATVPLIPAGHFGHDYYQLPLVVIGAPAIAYGLVQLVDRGIFSWKLAGIVCAAILVFSAAQIRHMIYVSNDLRTRIAFGKRVEQLVPRDSLMIFTYALPYAPTWYSHRTADGDLVAGDPTDFYNSHRKGWSLFASQTTPDMLQKLQRHNARYFATFYPKDLYKQSPEIKAYLEAKAVPVEITWQWIVYELPPSGKDTLQVSIDGHSGSH
jgi:membrane protein implicated in regulation of membrane protease activity